MLFGDIRNKWCVYRGAQWDNLTALKRVFTELRCEGSNWSIPDIDLSY